MAIGLNVAQPRVAGARRAASGALCMPLADGRWHFQHGPIDIIVGAHGDADAVAAAIDAAWQRFPSVLAELVAELDVLRRPLRVGDACPLEGVIARRMWRAVAPYARDYVTPMAAVAGSVADELARTFAVPGISRAWLNNGGDIALVLAPGERLEVAIGDAHPDRHLARLRDEACDLASIDAACGQRGVATSGWRGRSLSLGIADAVTVVARTAAQADAAATMIANATDLDDPRIARRAASELRDDTDLGSLPVTVDVPPLDPPSRDEALRRGEEFARACVERGLAAAVRIDVQGSTRVVVAASEGIVLGRARPPVAGVRARQIAEVESWRS